MRNDFEAALKDTLMALRILGVDLDPVPTLEVADTMFEQVKKAARTRPSVRLG